MQPIQFFAARAEDGALLPGASVDVFVHGSQERAVLFSDSAGNMPLSNPFLADANARVFFYSTTNRIDIQISRYGYVAPRIMDISTLDVATAVEQVRGEIDAALGEISDSLVAMEDEFYQLLKNSGYESAFLTYGAGVVIERITQLVQREDRRYRVLNPDDLPLTLTGTWATDALKLSFVGDDALRQELYDYLDPANTGFSKVGRAVGFIHTAAELSTVKGRYEGDVVYLAGNTSESDGFAGLLPWRASSTAPADGKNVYEVAGVPVGRWVRDKKPFTPSAAEVFTSIGSPVVAEVLRMQAMFKAEAIRRKAGCQPWVTLGPADMTKVGVTTDPRVNSAVISITSAASAQALAAGGTGTALDPYIIKNRNLTFASGTPAFVFNDPSATYYVRFYNVQASGTSNGSSAINMVAFGTPITFERCKFAGASGTGDETLATISAGALELYGCEVSGMSSYCFVGAGLTSKRVKLTDCIVVGTAKAVNTNGVFYAAAAGEFIVEIYRCSFTSRHFHWHVGNGWTIDYVQVQDTIIGGCAVGIGDLNYLKPGGNILSQLPNMIRRSHFKNVRFSYTPGVTQTAAYGNGADKCTFENCSFDGNVADRRLFEWRRTSDVTVLRCYFSKLQGGNTAGNEVCEFWESAGLTIQECWTNGAPEDCYELVSSYGRNKFIDNVADNVTGQIIDLFGVGSFDVEVNGVYGDCGDAVVLVTDVDYVMITNVFARQTGTSALGAVVLERRNAVPGASPKGCVVTGFLPLPAVCSQGKPFAIDTRQAGAGGGLGSNFATWWEDGELKLHGAANPDRLILC